MTCEFSTFEAFKIAIIYLGMNLDILKSLYYNNYIVFLPIVYNFYNFKY